MMKGRFLVLLAALFCASGWAAPADECLVPRGGGDIPSPFDTINAHVELASGEYYVLVGTVVAGAVPGQEIGSDYELSERIITGPSQPYLQIDLKQHPWLGGYLRRSFPYYPLQGGWGFWNQYLQKKVKVAVQANGVLVFLSALNTTRHLITLTPLDSNAVEILSP